MHFLDCPHLYGFQKMSTEHPNKDSDTEQVFDPEEDVENVPSSRVKDTPKVDDKPIISEAERERWEKKRNVSISKSIP